MLDMLGKLTKAAVATALTPVAVVVDVVRLPMNAFEGEAFPATKKLIDAAAENVRKAIEP